MESATNDYIETIISSSPEEIDDLLKGMEKEMLGTYFGCPISVWLLSYKMLLLYKNNDPEIKRRAMIYASSISDPWQEENVSNW